MLDGALHDSPTCQRANRCNRFSDRDLLMRHHWSLGVGHLHAHNQPSKHTVSFSTRDDLRREADGKERAISDVQSHRAEDHSNLEEEYTMHDLEEDYVSGSDDDGDPTAATSSSEYDSDLNDC
jgi:hypothetical protein